MSKFVEPENFLIELFNCAVETADPMLSIVKFIPKTPPQKSKGRCVVIGAGKASARMAEAVEQVWGACEGLVITRYGYARKCKGIKIVEAAHPVPDAMGVQATQEMRELLSSLTKDDFVLALISGGASALLCEPAGNLTLNEKQQTNSALLASGAPISQMNVVRKHLSRIKGGQLAKAACPAKVLCLMISDVSGDDPTYIGSGPTVGDNSTVDDARAIIQNWNIELPQNAIDLLRGETHVVAENDPCLNHVENEIIAAPSQSLNAAASLAKSRGVEVQILGDAIEGEARDVANEQAKLAMKIYESMNQGDQPILLLSGGELTVTRQAKNQSSGIGGPNAEFMLAMAIALDGYAGITALSCDTDGVDGGAEVAGATINQRTLLRAEELGISATEFLDNNDSHSFFEKLNSQIITGPTLTNVNDFRAILIVK